MDARTDTEASAAAIRRKLAALEAQRALDEAAIAYAAAEEEAQRESIANLQIALRTSRRIGAAIGVLMAGRRVTYDQAFDLLRVVSQDQHRKLRDIAEDVILTGEIPETRDRSDTKPTGNQAQWSQRIHSAHGCRTESNRTCPIRSFDRVRSRRADR